jgi:hypothetical protein
VNDGGVTNRIRLTFLAITLLSLGAIRLPAQAEPPLPGYRYFDFVPDPDIWGANGTATIGFRLFEGVDSAILLHYGAAWSIEHYYRLPDGALYRGDLVPGIPPDQLDFQKVTMPWAVGLVQGLHFNPATDRNDLNLFLEWRGQWNENLLEATPASILVQSAESARDWNLTNVFSLALRYDGVGTDRPANTRSGLTAEASLEWAPAGWSTPASTNYLQANLALSGFLPLYRSISPEGFNLISLYLCGYSAIDGILGLGTDSFRGIPFPVSRSFGGLEHRPGLGGSVRGIGDGWGDGTVKWVGNLELRCNLPAFIDPKLMFGVLGFVDAGAYGDPPGMPATAGLRSGFLLTAGLGAYLDFLGLGTLVARTVFMVNEPNAEGKYWVPIELDFGMMF